MLARWRIYIQKRAENAEAMEVDAATKNGEAAAKDAEMKPVEEAAVA